MKHHHFESFFLDEDALKLYRDGEELELEPQVFDVLLMLVQNHKRVVSKDEMIAKLWGGRVLSEHVITRTIYQLRKVLDRNDQVDSLIRTVRGKGYQFVGDVSLEGNAGIVNHKEYKFMPQVGWKIAVLWLLISLLVLLGVINAVHHTENNSQSVNNHSAGGMESDEYRVLTILPIRLPPDNEQTSILVMSLIDYLSYQLISHFNMKVVHPDSLLLNHDAITDVISIQRKTHSDFLIEGFIDSITSDSIQLRLMLHKKNRQGSMELFQLGSFRLDYPQSNQNLNDHYRQRKITAKAIVEVIKPGINLGSADFETQDPTAYRLAIAAYHMARSDDCDDMKRAEDLLLQALERDSEFVYAYLKLFDNYYKRVWVCGDSTDYHAKGLAMAQKIDQLAPNTYGAMNMRRGTILIESNQVEEAYVFASQASWNDPLALYDQSYALRYAGFLHHSAEIINRILQLEPFFFSEKPIMHAPNTLLYLNRFKDHLKLLAEPGNAYHDYFRGLNLYLSHQTDAASAVLEAVVYRTPDDLFGQFSQGLLHIIREDDEAAKRVIDSIVSQRIENHHTDGEMTYKLAQLYALSGHHEAALEQFQLAVDQGFFPVSYFIHDPAMINLVDNPAFQSIVQQADERHQAFARRHGLMSEGPGNMVNSSGQ